MNDEFDQGDSAIEDSIAIIGMSGRFPGAKNLREFWSNLRAGVDSLTRFGEDEAETPPWGSLKGQPGFVGSFGVLNGLREFDCEFFGISLRDAQWMDPQQRLFLECSWAALEDAGYDPERHKGPIAVYAGVGKSFYILTRINSVLGDPAAMFQALGTAGAESLATAVSYRLDLRGESMMVYTACSSSLVTVHMACQSLLTGQADVALAGGIDAGEFQKTGYIAQPGMILSEDGYCRAFDHRCSGTVFGSGFGVVVLKHLPRAIADNDHIYAVIRGSAINNDGRQKVGYTAPSVDGQADVIRKAIAGAGVQPSDVGYVEAHGTGTRLGDPIEIAALAQAYGLDGHRAASCVIGSVKTNIGHLNAASGVAGLIKTVLTLHHEEIPPSLHYERPNPDIDFASTPFAVNTSLRPWPRGDSPRIAAVSAFGIGGTNAHAVLQEAPLRPSPAVSSRPSHLVPLSARSPEAMDRLLQELADHLETFPDAAIPDVAYTRAIGRRAFEYRRAIAATDGAQLIAALRDPQSASLSDPARSLVFMFPGQGSQSVGMGREIYQCEPVFRAAIDRCAEVLRADLGLDLRSLIYPEDSERAHAAELLGEVRFTFPALFAVEYSLAQLLLSWGLRPAALLGYSNGEYLAACIAGVFTMEDTAHLVAVRAKLMHGVPAGAMMTMGVPAADAERYLTGSLAVAVMSSPATCVVGGTIPEIDALERVLADKQIDHRRLDARVAHHTAVMDRIVDEFARVVGAVKLSPPRIPCISNISGAWLRPEEATDPRYWAMQLRAPVRFDIGMDTVGRAGHTTFAEVGPGQSLAGMARQYFRSHADVVVVPTLARKNSATGDHRILLQSTGDLWSAGVAVDWEKLQEGTHGRRISLPSYPFEPTECWIEAQPLGIAGPSTGAREPAPQSSGPKPASATANKRRRRRPYVAPRSETESAIANIWRELLAVDEIGVRDEFLELGGHSLLATRVIARINEVLGATVSLREFFEAPTVEALAKQLASSAAGVATAGHGFTAVTADRARQHEPFPLTDVQAAYWVGRGQAIELGNIATHGYKEFEFKSLDLERFERAVQRVIARHDMLRAVVRPDGEQIILAEVPPYRVVTEDLSELAPEAAELRLEALRERMIHGNRPADRWPLFEIRAHRLSGSRTRVHLVIDYLVVDAWSVMLLAGDFARAYSGSAEELRPPAISFRDYVLAERALSETEFFRRSLAYWMNRLTELPAAPELPLAMNPGAIATPHFIRYSGRLEPAAWTRLRERAAAAGLTASGVVCAAYSEVLAFWSKSPRFTINVTTFNRLPLHPEVNEVVGDFTSLTLLAVDSARGATFEARARELQLQLLADLEHRHVSGVRVIRELARAGLVRMGGGVMPVVFTSTLTQTGAADGELPGDLDVQVVRGASQTAQVWLDHQVSEDRGALVFNWDVVEEIFPAGMVREMFSAFEQLLGQLADGDSTWTSTSRDLLPARQKTVRTQVNATDAPIPAGLLHDPFVAQAKQRAAQLAVISPGRTLTYGELYAEANRLAHWLRRQGAQPNKLVAIVMEKGWEQVVAAIAIVMSGAAYLPIDPALPRERLWHLLERGEVAIALTTFQLDQDLEWPAGVRRGCVDRDSDTGSMPSGALERIQTSADLAYVIFTSGSTGLPKGVMIDHRGALNTIVDIDQRFAVGPEDRVLALSALNFDLSVWDIFGVLGAGGAIVFPAASASRDPDHWLALMHEHRVTIWNSVPALLLMLVETTEGGRARIPQCLRLAMLSGDWVPVSLPARLVAQVPAARVFSLGGATEASIWSIVYPVEKVDPAWRSIPYGKAMLNQRFHVYSEAMEPSPEWVPGQLFIAGIGLACGYWRDDAKTNASFFAHPRTGERLYRTGDLGRFLPDGNIEFLGREDTQVKVQGYRIELGEIEAALTQHAGVRDAVVIAAGEVRAARRLVGYVVPDAARPPAISELRAFLQSKLPEYMVPPDFVMLESLPLSANGKVDRRALPMPGQSRDTATAEFIAPRDPLEVQLVAIWEGLLERRPIGARTHFFDAGGDSIRAVRMAAQIHTRLNRRIGLADILARPNIEAIAEFLRGPAGSAPASALVSIVHGDTRTPLFCVHPIGGTVLCYSDLARHMKDGRAFHGLQSPACDGDDEPATSVVAMATQYLAAIKSVQTRGPYLLAGWSFGGIVALEIATMLRAGGDTVGLVALIDSFPHDGVEGGGELADELIVQSFVADLAGIGRSRGAEESTSIAGDPGSLAEFLRNPRTPQTDPHLARIERLFRVYRANVLAARDHDSSPYDGRVLLVRATHTNEASVHAWRAVLVGTVETCVVDGDHYSIMARPAVGALAKSVENAIERVDGLV